MSLVHASIEKIKQDKLNVRRTTLSAIDQAFVNATVKAAEDEGIEIESTIKARATVEVEPAPDVVVPTSANTKAEIQAFMDEHEIAYESDNNKATLISLIDAWQAESDT